MSCRLVCLFVCCLLCAFAGLAAAAWLSGPLHPLPLVPPGYAPERPLTLPDGEGGCWVVFDEFSYMGPTNGLYVTRLDHDGDVAVPRTLVGGYRNYHDMPMSVCSDGAQGLLILYHFGGDPAFMGVHAQRVSPSGAPEWGTAGVRMDTTFNSAAVESGDIVSDGAGGAIVVWQTYQGGGLAQHVLATGVVDPAWPAEGWKFAGARTFLESAATSDGRGGAIVAVGPNLGTLGHLSLWLYHVLSNGTLDPAWPAGGLELPGPTNASKPQLQPDGAGGVFVMHEDEPISTSRTAVHHVLANGTLDPAWPSNGAPVQVSGSMTESRFIADGTGGVIAAWAQPSGEFHVYAMRLLAGGSPDPAWPATGVNLVSAPHSQLFPMLASDGRGGAWCTWQDSRLDLGYWQGYVHHVLSTGALDTAIPVNGALLGDIFGAEHPIAPVADGSGGLIVVWGPTPGMFAQRFDRWGLAGAHPVITSLTDTPNDEGGSVNVTFARSWLDTMLTLPVSAYRMWREVPSTLVAAKLASGSAAIAFDPEQGSGADAAPGALRTTQVNGVKHWWEMYTAIAAHGAASYTVPVGTMCDATPTSSPRTWFMVEARASDGVRAWVSPPDSCVSLDNLAPAAPASGAGVYGGGSVSLHWRASAAADLARYAVHRGSSASFTPSAANLVATVTDTTWSGAANTPYWYRVCGVDVHGNEGASLALLPNGSLDVADGPAAAFALAPPVPNPSRGETSLAYTLPREALVTLALYDAQGRLVRTLAHGARPAGAHALAWDGRDESGRAVPAGLYFARLSCDGRTLSRRLLRLP